MSKEEYVKNLLYDKYLPQFRSLDEKYLGKGNFKFAMTDFRETGLGTFKNKENADSLTLDRKKILWFEYLNDKYNRARKNAEARKERLRDTYFNDANRSKQLELYKKLRDKIDDVKWKLYKEFGDEVYIGRVPKQFKKAREGKTSNYYTFNAKKFWSSIKPKRSESETKSESTSSSSIPVKMGEIVQTEIAQQQMMKDLGGKEEVTFTMEPSQEKEKEKEKTIDIDIEEEKSKTKHGIISEQEFQNGINKHVDLDWKDFVFTGKKDTNIKGSLFYDSSNLGEIDKNNTYKLIIYYISTNDEYIQRYVYVRSKYIKNKIYYTVTDIWTGENFNVKGKYEWYSNFKAILKFLNERYVVNTGRRYKIE